MRKPSSMTETIAQASEGIISQSRTPTTASPSSSDEGRNGQAAQGPISESVSATGELARAIPADSPTEAEGRRTLSTAFVRVGPDGYLTVELRDGRVLVLRNVAMRAKDYCGVQVSGSSGGKRHCGGYADVASARPGGVTDATKPDAVVSNPIGSDHPPSVAAAARK